MPVLSAASELFTGLLFIILHFGFTRVLEVLIILPLTVYFLKTYYGGQLRRPVFLGIS
jgi:hypothetical protein